MAVDTLEAIRRAVMHQIGETAALHSEDLCEWARTLKYVAPILSLNSEGLRFVRLMTEIFTGESLMSIVFPPPESDFVAANPYRLATLGLPEQYKLSEPTLPLHNELTAIRGSLEGTETEIGTKVGSRYLTPDLCRHQHYFKLLHDSGTLEYLRTIERPIYFEIGAGFGSFGYQFKKTHPGARIYIVDLPPMLLFSGCYLAQNLPNEKIYIYDPKEGCDNAALDEASIVLVPNYRLDLLQGMKEIHLAVNTLSFPEMAIESAVAYLDFIKPRLSGVFFYDNFLGKTQGTQLASSARDAFAQDAYLRAISERFSMSPSTEFYAQLYERLGTNIGAPASVLFNLFITQSDTESFELAGKDVVLRLAGPKFVHTKLGEIGFELIDPHNFQPIPTDDPRRSSIIPAAPTFSASARSMIFNLARTLLRGR